MLQRLLAYMCTADSSGSRQRWQPRGVVTLYRGCCSGSWGQRLKAERQKEEGDGALRADLTTANVSRKDRRGRMQGAERSCAHTGRQRREGMGAGARNLQRLPGRVRMRMRFCSWQSLL